MCFAKTIYTCQHEERKRITCRKTWRQRAGWCFRPILLFFVGDSPDEPCSELRVNDNVWPNVTCPECRTAEETGIATKGMVTSTTTTNKYREKLTPAAIAASRRRKEEQEKKDEKQRTNYWSIQENYQEGLRKREMEEAARLQGGGGVGDVTGGNEDYADRPLPALPTFPAASVGDTRGDPGYQDPRLRSKNIFPPPKPSPSPSPPPENKSTTKHKRKKKEAPVVPDRRMPTVTSTGSPISKSSQRSREHKRRHSQEQWRRDSQEKKRRRVEEQPRRNSYEQTSQTSEEGAYERPTKENYYGRGTASAIRTMKEADEPSPARQPVAERRGRDMKQLANSYREVRAAPWPEEPIIQRRPTPPPSPEPEKAPKKSGKLKGVWNPFGNKDRRDDVAH
ncbi:hypothetical protein BDP81DRAFT_449604 [Colletotrichum phormii]|uniref:Uncharacterized protein n=1 Tax=Colletotrichum phormii TaxID=359342 RepID=A0AAI9ZRM6_9PEZI|nr:uncharacterized protein BDP81DRAFT_449604 [Colletotrichum phormii]KAK1636606.1 hypothetical protein BDP81DRAFT_449604 [Colletotrichum phormii]